MIISFDPDVYVAALQALMTAKNVPIRVSGWQPDSMTGKMLDGAIAELVIDSFPCSKIAGGDAIEGPIDAGLIVTRSMSTRNSEGACFALALKVAIALDQYVENFGTIYVHEITREPLPDELEHRYVAYRVSFSQSVVVRQLDVPLEGGPLTDLYLGKVPDVGPGHEPDYKHILALRRGEGTTELELEGEAQP